MSDNRKGKVLIEIDEGDLSMLEDALQLAANTAMFYSRDKARARLSEYVEEVKSLVQTGARFFEGFAWAEICMELKTAKEAAVYVEATDHSPFRRDYVNREAGNIFIEMNGRQFRSEGIDKYRWDGQEVASVVSTLKDMAPLDCEITAQHPVDDQARRASI